MIRALLIVLAVLSSSAAAAQNVPCTDQNTFGPLQPAERDTVALRWDRTLTTATATLTLRSMAKPDSTPNAMIVAGPTASGDHVNVTLLPDNGCGTPGCRNGNVYQLSVQATDTNGNLPIGDVCVSVKKKQMVP